MNTSSVTFDQLWTVRDVMRFLQASRSWVYQKAEESSLPSVRVGGLLRFDPEAVRRWALGAPAQVLPLARGAR